jgi:hypothetical protein
MSRPLAIAPSFVVSSIRLAKLVVSTLGLILVMAAPRGARANGAFPESYQLVLPADRPRQVILATNFGLIISDDDGATWTWTCEQKATVMGALYGVSAAPLDRLFSLSTLVGLSYSDDDSCSWTASSGALDTVLASDYFADPTNPLRVYALGRPPNDDTVPPKLFDSDDGGKTFGTTLFTAPAGATLSGIESARSDPSTLYLATFTTGFHPTLQRSKDGGTTWTPLDVEPSLGANNFRIIAVDPNDAQVLTVRVIETTGESVAISRDGGVTFTKVAHVAGQLTAYVRLDSGTILIAGALAIDGVGFRSTDGGLTFTDWTPRTTSDGGVPDLSEDGGAPRPPHLRALAARGGKLYGAAKNFSDDWAVGVSMDEGVTFQRLARYDEVASIRACVQTLCVDSCDSQAGAQIWPPITCIAPDARTDAGVVTPPPAKKGCGCGVAGARDASGTAAAVGAFAALWLTRARRRRRR